MLSDRRTAAVLLPDGPVFADLRGSITLHEGGRIAFFRTVDGQRGT